ncbi:MAG: hypothetical protein AAGN66_13105 [Acidobacteriota bacterium]
MKKVDLSKELYDQTTESLDAIEQDVFGGRVKTDVKAGAANGCIQGACPGPLYGVPDDFS